MKIQNRRCGAAIAAVLFLISACRQSSAPLPEGLEGIWRTTAPGYADDLLQITPTTITFRSTRPDGPSGAAYPIDRVEHRTEAGRNIYTIVYVDEAREESHLAVAVDAADPGTIVFVNQAHLRWSKQGAQS
ncbi:MAG: hypothetical protein U0172_08485 [Nitrospiraceae bacterium]